MGDKQIKEKIESYTFQQAFIARLGQRALECSHLLTFMTELVTEVAKAVNVEFCKILELLPGSNALMLRSGIGWKKGVVGHTKVYAKENSQAGYTLLTTKPVIVEDINKETRFKGPSLLIDHGVVSGISVIIGTPEHPFGVLSVHTAKKRLFGNEDANFLQAAANILAAAIERKKAEDKRSMFSALIEQSSCAVIVTDTNGSIEYVNSQFMELTGYAQEEVIGLNPRILKSGKTSPDEYKRLWKTITSGKKWKGVFCNKKKDGSLYWEMVSISPFRNEEGIVTHFFAIKEDITKQKQREELLRRNEQRLSNAQKIAHLGNWEWNIVRNELWWSDEINRIFGITPQEFEATYEAFLNTVHTDDRIFVENSVKEALYEKKPYAIDHRIVLPDGGIRIVHEEGEVVFDDAGRPIQMNGTVQDITERKQYEQRREVLYTLSNILMESVSVDEAIPKILQTIGEGLQWDFGEFWSIDQKTNELRRYAEVWHTPSKKFPEFKEISARIFFPPGLGLPGRIWKNRKPQWITNVVCDEKFLRLEIAAKEGLHGAFGFPVLSEGNVMGVFTFFNSKILFPDEDLLRLMTFVGIQIGQFVKRKQAEDYIQHMAYHDTLTGLPNRNLFQDRLEMAYLQAKRNNSMVAVMALDLDGFKTINDSLGHHMGDLLLKEVAVRMKKCVRECDTIARIGGDEFMVILTNIYHRESVNHVADKILDLLSQHFLINNNKIGVTVSIGICLYPLYCNNMQDLIRKADNALYCSKKQGKNTYRFYNNN